MASSHAASLRAKDAYIGEVHVEGAPQGPLKGLTAVVKDCFAVAGTHTSNGSPAWLATHPRAERHAAAVQALLEAGVTVVGKSIMDEMVRGEAEQQLVARGQGELGVMVLSCLLQGHASGTFSHAKPC